MSKKKQRAVNQTIKDVLPNGITLLIKEDHSVPTVSAVAFFLGGRILETEETNGISSLTQRLILRGAGEYSAEDIFLKLETYGIKMRPFFGGDTAGLKMKTLSKNFETALDIFSQAVQEPSFPQEEFDKEKDLQIKEIHQQKDNLLSFCIEKCDKLVYGRHPYGLPSIGTVDSVKSLEREQVLDYYSKVYNPQHLVLAVVGDIRTDYVIEQIHKRFANYKGHELNIPIEPALEPIKNVRELSEPIEKQQTAICIGFQAPNVESENFYTFSILNQVLSGMGARLFVELRDRQGLAYSVNSSYTAFQKSGIFRAYILTGYKQKERARLSLLEEVDRLRTRLVSYDELVRAKRYHLGLFDISLQSNTAAASNMAYYELMKIGYDFIEKYEDRVKLITRQKVKRAAEKYLKPQSYAIALLTPATYPKNLR